MKFNVSTIMPQGNNIFIVRPEIRESHWFSDIKRAVTHDHDQVCIDTRQVSRKYVIRLALSIFRHHFVLGKYKTDTKSKKNILSFIVQHEQDVREIKSRLMPQWFGNKLATEPANMLYPERFCQVVKAAFARVDNVSVKVLDEKQLEKKGFGLVLSVGQSSQLHPPRFLICKVGKGSRTICAIGKGVIFDSGGYNLKTSAGMVGMNADKTGGALVVALAKYFGIEAPTALPRDTRLVILVPLVENMVGQFAQRVGDVHTAYNGKTVEVLNTDAEGRLILADALAFACAVYKPHLVLDFATLTGWANTLHCDTSFVFYTENEKLASLVTKSGCHVGERSIRMPAWPEYMEDTKSQIADYKNAYFTTCEKGGGYMATMFLANFVTPRIRKTAWIHFDITHIQNQKGMSTCNGLQTAIEIIKSAHITA